MSDSPNPLSGMTTGEELGVLGQTGRGVLDWREGNLLGLRDALAEKASSLTPKASDALAPGWFEQPILQAFASPSSIRGFHGTGVPRFEPVEGNPFGEFRLDKVGTGEGAAAYGHGAAYVAGNRAVAEDYANKLGGPGITTIDGKSAFDHPQVSAEFPHIQTAVNELNSASGNPERAMSQIDGHIGALDENGKNLSWYQEERDRLSSAKNWINENQSKLGWQPSGSLLEVHILPDEHELLDWDKPIQSQSPAVQSGLAKIYEKYPDLQILSPPKMMSEGQYLYRNLAQMLWDKTREGIGIGSQRASAALHEAGIPGIKYLDAGSRRFDVSPISYPDKQTWGVYEQGRFPTNQGEAQAEFPTREEAESHVKSRQTSNYVIFHPSNLRIVGRNGQHLEPIDEDPFK